MTSKVIIRIGEESEHVDREDLIKRGNITFANDFSVVFANVDIYYVIVTEKDKVERLRVYLEDDSLDVNEMMETTNAVVRDFVREYAEDNFAEFTQRVEKSIKTAHGVGVQKASKRWNKRSRSDSKGSSRKTA